MNLPFILVVLLTILAVEAVIFCGIGIVAFICMAIDDIKHQPHPQPKK